MSLKNLNATTKIPKFLRDSLNNKRINKIYKKFEVSLNINESFAVAVSGGPDSLALAFLSKIYAIKKNLISKYFIIDHKLRPESTDEAKFVSNLLKKNFIKSEILTWKGKKPQKSIQSIARTKRYELLFKKCDQFKINDILMGHHEDDLIENFFMRLLRGSGIKGLTSLDIKTIVKKKNILRPLIDIKKDDLIFISKKVFKFHVKDPTNSDEKYQRTRVRKLIKDLEKDGLDKIKLKKTITNLKNANKVITFYVEKNLRENTSFFKDKKKLIINSNFFLQPQEVIFRSFSESLKLISEKYYSVRGKKLNKIILEIENNRLNRATLGGCIIEKVNQSIIISKEP
tara:strand:- start:434 stop:1462 length:1029 start_codon:yes stop_codon:yes gene_type:complete